MDAFDVASRFQISRRSDFNLIPRIRQRGEKFVWEDLCFSAFSAKDNWNVTGRSGRGSSR